MNILKDLIKYIEPILPDIIKHRRHLHRHPELSFKEFETSEYILKVLNNLGIPARKIAGTGVVGLIGNSGKCVALRADMDALPIVEETGLEFSSLETGKMHACGHDLHLSMLLGAATVLKKMESTLDGCVKLIFQPAEEMIPGGAKAMIDEGVLDDPKVEAVFGQHVFPSLPVGTVGFVKGPAMASADELYWTITGTGGHAAQPHLSNNPILSASALVQNLQNIMITKRNPLLPGVLSVTSIHGGTANNIFPETVEMKGTLRTFDNEWREAIHNEITIISNATCFMYNTKCDIEIRKGYPPVINDPVITEIAKAAIGELNNNLKSVDIEPIMWAEDFAYFAEKVPSTFWFLGIKPENADQMAPLHNPRFNPDEGAILYGTALLVGAAVKALESFEEIV